MTEVVGETGLSPLDLLRKLLGAAFSGSPITQSYGVIGINGRSHTGVDLAAAEFTPVQEPVGGTLERVILGDTIGGNQVVVRTAAGYREVYAHLASVPAYLSEPGHEGVAIPQGATLGYVGQTGLATGPHLHYEVVKPGGQIGSLRGTIDPLAFIAEFASPGGAAVGTQPVFGAPPADIAKNAKDFAGTGNPLDNLTSITSGFNRLVTDLTDTHTWARLGLTVVAGALLVVGVVLYARPSMGVQVSA